MLNNFFEALNDKKWVFIAGCNNSGTWLIYRYLAQHGNIDFLTFEGKNSFFMSWRTFKERIFWNKYIKIPSLGKPKLELTRVWTEALERSRNPPIFPLLGLFLLKYDWLKHRATRGGEYILEKSPPNCVRIPWLREKFPNSKFLCVIRNGYAVSEGIMRRNLKVPERGFNIQRSAEHWYKANKVMFTDLEQMIEEKKLSIDDYVIIKYEDFCENPINELSKIEQMLKISDWSYKDLENIRNFNDAQISRLSSQDIQTIKIIASEMLEKFDY
jgi:hypothetical protein